MASGRTWINGRLRKPCVSSAVIFGLVGSTLGLSDVAWLRVVFAGVFVVVMMIAVARFVEIGGDADYRRRRAILWLRAFEDDLRR